MGGIIFLIGIMFGSAANALIDRLPRGQSWISGRSMCDKCKHTLLWRDLFPILSFLVLRGRCRYCHSPIPARNLLVEVAMGLGWGLLFKEYGFTGYGLLLMGILWATVIVAVMDLETKLVSETMVLVWGAMVVMFHYWDFSLEKFIGLGMALAVIGGVWFFSKGKAMGFGDVEIAVVMGYWLSWQQLSVALWVAFVLGALVGVLQMARRKANMKSQMAFGPYLVVGSWVAFFWGELIWRVWGG